MRPDDVALLESIVLEIVDALTPALRSAELALEVLAARRRPSARPPDLLLAALIDESRFAVHWNGATCELGATVLFRLFRRLVRSADRFPFEPSPANTLCSLKALEARSRREPCGASRAPAPFRRPRLPAPRSRSR